MSVASRSPGLLALAIVAGCEFDIPPSSYISVTEIVSVRQEVVELGPLAPERAGPHFEGIEDAPIAEFLPGDRVRLEVVVVDPTGRILADDEVETLWFACGRSFCERYSEYFMAEVFDTPCESLADLTLDSICRLGAGTTALEFLVPEVGPDIASSIDLLDPFPHLAVFAVAAWGGRRAEDCWASRRGDRAALDRCGFIHHSVAIGPKWQLLSHAEALGLDVPRDPERFPPWVFLQPANRVPRTPALTVKVADEVRASGIPPLAPIPVDPGAEFTIELGFDLFSQLLQGRFEPLSRLSDDFFIAVPELVGSRTATTGAIQQLGDPLPVLGDASLSYVVEPLAPPGVSRVLIVYFDDRGAHDLLSLDFEVQAR